MREAVGSQCRIKASGGIKDLAAVTAMVEQGRSGSGQAQVRRSWKSI